MGIDSGAPAVVGPVASIFERSWLRRPWSRRALLLYGFIAAILGSALLFVLAPSSWPIESSRAASLQGALRELNAGGPPLLARFPAGHGAHSFYLEGTSPGDDQGAFFYVPGLAHVLGLSHAISAMRILYVILFFLPLLVYPLLFARLFDSTAAGLVAPWALVLVLRGLYFHDILWIAEWSVLALLPPLMLLDRRWHRWAIAWLALLMLAASFANSIRSQSGLGVALAALVVLVRSPWRWRWRLAALPLLAACYLAINPLGLHALLDLRNNWVGHGFGATGESHLVWHPILLGLGYLPNRYGLHWDDSIAVAIIHAFRPSVHYPTAAYDAAVRHVFLQLVKRDPGLLLRSLGAKLLVVLLFALPAIVLLLLSGAAMAVDRRRVGPALRCLVLVVPALLVELVPPLLGIPALEYQLGWLAGMGLGCIVALSWLLARISPSSEDVERARPGEALTRAWRWLGGSWRHAGAVAAIVLALLAVGVTGNRIRERAARWQLETPAVPDVHDVLPRGG